MTLRLKTNIQIFTQANRTVLEKRCVENDNYLECQLKMTIKNFTWLDSDFYTCERKDIFERSKATNIQLFTMSKAN